MKRHIIAPAVGALCALLAAGEVAGQCVVFDPGGRAFKNCPRGNAVLSIGGGGEVIVNDVGATGLDGVEWFLADLEYNPRAATDLAGYSMAQLGNQMTFITRGYVNGDVNPRNLLRVNVVREDVNSAGFPSTLSIYVDFSPIDAAAYDALIDGQPAQDATGLQGRVLIRGATPGRDETPPVHRTLTNVEKSQQQLRASGTTVSHTLQWPEPVEILLPNQAAVTVGQSITFVASHPAVAPRALSSVQVTGRNVLSFVITDENALYETIPTLSQWGLIILGVGLVAAGVVVVRKRAIQAA